MTEENSVQPYKAPNDLTARKLVDYVLEEERSFKDVSRKLNTLPPDEDASRRLVDAFENGESPPWLTAHLLGCVGHSAGYQTVRSILELGPGLLAESYASAAMVKIAGDGATRDLLDVLENCPHIRSREAAASGLRELGGGEISREEISASIVRAVADTGLRRKKAATALAELGVTESQMLALLRSKNKNEWRVGGTLLYDEYRGVTSNVPVTAEVIEAARDLLATDGVYFPRTIQAGLEKMLGKQDKR